MNGTSKNGQGTFGTSLTRLTPASPSGPVLVDPYGRPVTADDARAYGPPGDPLKNSSEAGVLKRDIPINLITRWTTEAMQSALDNHMVGQFAQSAYLCDAITGDDRVAATLGQRMGAVFSRPMVTVPMRDGKPSDDAEAVAVADAWDVAWERFAPQSVLEEFHAWGTLLAASPGELQWDRSVTPWQPILKPWHPTHLYYRWDLRKYAMVTMDQTEILEPGDGRWMLHTPHGPYRGWRRGCVRPIALPWFVRQLSWRDHARFNERHGLAIIKAMAPARSDPGMRDRWVQGLSQLGQESVVLCPQNVDGTGFDLALLEAKDRAWESFGALASRADMSIVLTLLWQNLTTEVSGGSYAAAVVHEGVQQAGARFDANTLATSIYYQAARPFAAWNFGNPGLAPMRKWVIEKPADHLTSAQAFAAFAKAVSDLKAGGYELTVDGLISLAFAFNLPLTAGQVVKVAVAVASGADPPKEAPP